MKETLLLTLTLITGTVFAQTNTCEIRLENARRKVQELTSELRACRNNTGSTEVIVLREENRRLREENTDLRIRLEEATGGNRPLTICAAGCTGYTGTIDQRYLALGTSEFASEADMLAKQAAMSEFRCTYSPKTYRCEVAESRQANNFCVAACTGYTGTPDDRYTAGARGRNKLEAEILALKAVQKQFNCTYSPKVISCN